jgi:hypothetical protein
MHNERCKPSKDCGFFAPFGFRAYVASYFYLLKSAGAQRKTLDPGVRRDDGGNFTAASTTTVAPTRACNGGFRPHAVYPDNGAGLQVGARPAGLKQRQRLFVRAS